MTALLAPEQEQDDITTAERWADELLLLWSHQEPGFRWWLDDDVLLDEHPEIDSAFIDAVMIARNRWHAGERPTPHPMCDSDVKMTKRMREANSRQKRRAP